MSDPSKVALITGGARRIGKAIVHHLHAHGYRVAVHAHQSGHELHAFLTELERTRPSTHSHCSETCTKTQSQKR